MQIASYNSHLGLLRSERCLLDTTQLTRHVVRPTSLCHHLSNFPLGNRPRMTSDPTNPASRSVNGHKRGFTVLTCPRAVRGVLGRRSNVSFTRGLNHDE